MSTPRHTGRPATVGQKTGTWSGELDDLLALDGGLTDWELTFIDSARGRRDWDGCVTVKQAAKIAEIWDRECGGGS